MICPDCQGKGRSERPKPVVFASVYSGAFVSVYDGVSFYCDRCGGSGRELMICADCQGWKWQLDVGPYIGKSMIARRVPRKGCGGSGIAHCCEGDSAMNGNNGLNTENAPPGFEAAPVDKAPIDTRITRIAAKR